MSRAYIVKSHMSRFLIFISFETLIATHNTKLYREEALRAHTYAVCVCVRRSICHIVEKCNLKTNLMYKKCTLIPIKERFIKKGNVTMTTLRRLLIRLFFVLWFSWSIFFSFALRLFFLPRWAHTRKRIRG